MDNDGRTDLIVSHMNETAAIVHGIGGQGNHWIGVSMVGKNHACTVGARAAWEVNGQRVRPQDITSTALLTIEGELDDISGAGQTKAAHELCKGIPRERQFHYDVEGAGHYGIFSGRRWREAVYPQVRRFIADHQEPMTRGARGNGNSARARRKVPAGA